MSFFHFSYNICSTYMYICSNTAVKKVLFELDIKFNKIKKKNTKESSY